jgi:malonate transporter MadM subunit
MTDFQTTLSNLLAQNGLLTGFVFVALLALFSNKITKRVLKDKLQWSAVAMFIALALAFAGGLITDGKKGLADVAAFSGLAYLGSSMMQEFTVVSLVAGVDFEMFKKYAPSCLLSLALGLVISFVPGAAVAWLFGYRDAVSITTIAAGSLTFVVGPVTGAALGASSVAIAISVATGLFKTVAIIICAPLLAKYIGLDSPKAAVVFGGLMGTKSGTIAGLAATDEALVPYGVLSTAFYTGFGCLLCPSLFYGIVKLLVGQAA